MKLTAINEVDSRATCPLCQCYSPIEPAGQGRGQTVQAEPGEVGGGKGVLRGGAGEEEAAAGKRGPPTAAIGMGRTWVSAGQSRWAGPGAAQRKQTITVLLKGQAESTSQTSPLGLKYPKSRERTHWGRDAADGIVLPAEDHRARWDLLRGGARRKDGRRSRSRHWIRHWS